MFILHSLSTGNVDVVFHPFDDGFRSSEDPALQHGLGTFHLREILWTFLDFGRDCCKENHNIRKTLQEGHPVQYYAERWRLGESRVS